MTRKRVLWSLSAVLAVSQVPAVTAWDLDPGASASDLNEFHVEFASAAHFYPRHGAGQLGVTGIEVFADLSASEELDDGDAVKRALSGDLPAGIFAVARVGARKGLPGRVNLGLTYGEVLDGDIGLWAGELQWSIIDGGLVKPSVAWRLTATRFEGSSIYEADSYGMDVYVSKGIGPLNAYAGIGLIDSEGVFRRSSGERFEADETMTVYFAGAVLDFLIPKLTVALEKGESLQAALRVGFGW